MVEKQTTTWSNWVSCVNDDEYIIIRTINGAIAKCVNVHNRERINKLRKLIVKCPTIQ